MEIIFKALGYKAYDENKKADVVGWVRVSYALLQIITCFAIIANCVRHWN